MSNVQLDRQRREENLISLTAIDNEDMNAVESRQYNALPVGNKRPTPPPRPNKLPPRISERIKRRENGGPARRTGDVQEKIKTTNLNDFKTNNY